MINLHLGIVFRTAMNILCQVQKIDDPARLSMVSLNIIHYCKIYWPNVLRVFSCSLQGINKSSHSKVLIPFLLHFRSRLVAGKNYDYWSKISRHLYIHMWQVSSKMWTNFLKAMYWGTYILYIIWLYVYILYVLYTLHIIYCIYIIYMYIYHVIYIDIWTKKAHNLFKITNISLLFRNFVKLLKRREIFVILNKWYVFFVHIFQVTHLKLAFV